MQSDNEGKRETKSVEQKIKGQLPSYSLAQAKKCTSGWFRCSDVKRDEKSCILLLVIMECGKPNSWSEMM